MDVQGKRLRFETTGDFADPEDIGDLFIRATPVGEALAGNNARAGELLRLRDIATVRRGYQEPASTLMRYDGLPAMALSISNVSGGNIVELGNALDQRIAELSAELPIGIEISRSLVEFARTKFPGIEFVNCQFEDFEPVEKFGAVYCSEVLEHMVDPRAFTKKIYDLLVPGGLLFLTTPSLLQYRIGDLSPNLGAPDHKVYFDHKSIKLFFKSIGFRTIVVRREFKFSLRNKPRFGRGGIKCYAFK